VTSAERARALTDSPAYLLGAGEAHSHRQISHMPDLTTTSAVQSGERAFAMAGLTTADVDVALAHGNGGVLSAQCTVLLGDASTL
jgi:3-oxoacyl-(acyl-carrier-protein) synthase